MNREIGHHSQDSWVSQQLADPALRLAFDQERATREFSEQLDQVLVSENISRAELAKRLGKSRAYITQTLRKGRNLTIATMAEIAGACGFELHVRLHRRQAEGGPIFTEPCPDWHAVTLTSTVTLEAKWEVKVSVQDGRFKKERPVHARSPPSHVSMMFPALPPSNSAELEPIDICAP